MLSTSVGKSFIEYQIPNEQYDQDGIQPFSYNLVKEKFQDDELVEKFVNRVAQNIDYTPSFAIISAQMAFTSGLLSLKVGYKKPSLADLLTTNSVLSFLDNSS